MQDADYYRRKADEWAEMARMAGNSTERDLCREVEASFRSLAESVGKLHRPAGTTSDT